jgi:Tropinone reductase 1
MNFSHLALRVETDRGRLLEWMGTHWGSLDVLVNNAGINIRKRSVDYSREEYMQVLEIDLLAAFECDEKRKAAGGKDY